MKREIERACENCGGRLGAAVNPEGKKIVCRLIAENNDGTFTKLTGPRVIHFICESCDCLRLFFLPVDE